MEFIKTNLKIDYADQFEYFSSEDKKFIGLCVYSKIRRIYFDDMMFEGMEINIHHNEKV